MNLTVFSQSDNLSPFDTIRRYDANGNEYWLARELMPLLDYKQWRRFNDAIERAIVTCQNSGNTVSNNFLPTSAKSLGRTGEDYKLTRYACYLIAMNGDPRKEAIANAQTYFAVKTHEAEIIVPQQKEEIETLKLRLEVLKAEKEVAQAQQKLIDTRHLIVTTCPEPIQQKILGYQVVKEVERVEVVIDKNSGQESDGVGITYVSKMLGFKNTQQCWSWLEKIGYGKNSPKWHNELTAINTPKLSRDDLQYLKDIFAECRKDQQMFIGE